MYILIHLYTILYIEAQRGPRRGYEHGRGSAHKDHPPARGEEAHRRDRQAGAATFTAAPCHAGHMRTAP